MRAADHYESVCCGGNDAVPDPDNDQHRDEAIHHEPSPAATRSTNADQVERGSSSAQSSQISLAGIADLVVSHMNAAKKTIEDNVIRHMDGVKDALSTSHKEFQRK
jgi:hypothetical protein